MIYRILCPLLLACAGLFAAPSTELLKLADVRQTMQKMLSYHVEYKELTPLLVRRSFKVFIDQFDPDKVYFLQTELQPFLELSDAQVQEVIGQYQQDAFPLYQELAREMQRAVVRARKLRQDLQEQLVQGPEIASAGAARPTSFAGTTEELKVRVMQQQDKLLAYEKKVEQLSSCTPDQRRKMLLLWERRLRGREEGYAKPNDTHLLALHLLKAMAKSLDIHSHYFSPEEALEMRTSLQKQFEGVGVVLRESIYGVRIVDLVKGGPAHRSGQIQAGDFLVEIDGKSLEGIPYDRVLEMLRMAGRQLVLGIRRAQGSPLRVSLTKERISMQEERVQCAALPFGDGLIARLTLPAFYEGGGGRSCEQEMRDALKRLRTQGNVLGLVVDMRENSGGFLSQAVKVASLFLSSGVVVISKYANGEVQYLRNIDGRVFYNGPLVLLTSKASASAAEIVAQALQDYGTAVIVGDVRTYGKGTIQYQTITDQGAKTFFKVTVGRYYTVSGRSPQIEGVQADIVVPTPYATYPIGEKYLEYALPRDGVPAAYIDPLTDVEASSRPWFQKNYLPQLQRKESYWIQKLPILRTCSQHRLDHDPNFQLFLHSMEARELSEGHWGKDDLQMGEAVNLLKDMILLKLQKK